MRYQHSNKLFTFSNQINLRPTAADYPPEIVPETGRHEAVDEWIEETVAHCQPVTNDVRVADNEKIRLRAVLYKLVLIQHLKKFDRRPAGAVEDDDGEHDFDGSNFLLSVDFECDSAFACSLPS